MSIVTGTARGSYFYSRILGFDPADAIEPIAIDNL